MPLQILAITIGDVMAKNALHRLFPARGSDSRGLDVRQDRVCVGDAIHEMTPNMGQGASRAIEGAQCLRISLSRCSSTAVVRRCRVQSLGYGKISDISRR